MSDVGLVAQIPAGPVFRFLEAQDAVVGLGVDPVAVPEQNWGGDENKLLPWLTASLAAQGLALPQRVNFDNDIPYEQVLALQPESGPDNLLAKTGDLPGGAYKLHWQVLSVDGHISRGDIPFRVKTP